MKFPVFFQPKMSDTYKDILRLAKRTHEITTNPYQMYCPYCGSPLKRTDRMEHLVTLSEEVSGASVTPKHVYKCSNPYGGCVGNMAMWASSGEMYNDFEQYGPENYDICHEYLYKNPTHKYGWPQSAINSSMYIAELDTYCPGKKKKYVVRWFKNQKIIPVITCNYKYDSFGKCKYVSVKIKFIKTKHND